MSSAPTRTSPLSPLPVLLKEVLDAVPLAVVLFDAELGIVYRNLAADALWPPTLTVTDLLNGGAGGHDIADWIASVRRVIQGGRPKDVLRSVPASVASGFIGARGAAITVTPLVSATQDVVYGGMLIADPNTTRPGLGHSDRLALPSESNADPLAARVAHELNNPLDGVLRYVNLALRSVAGGGAGEATGHLEKARAGLQRMTRFVRDVLDDARPTRQRGAGAGINEIVEDAVRSLRDDATARGVVITAGYRGEHMPAIPGSSLYQVCRNLIQNAIQAMPAGGILTIKTAVTADAAVLRFEDTGEGLPDDPERVFAPFYTTRQHQGGTGLGLAICRDHVQRLGGTITAAPREGGGAVFTVRLPLK